MRKQSLFVKLYLSAMLVFFAPIGANAQVTIGSSHPPSDWSLLDLQNPSDTDLHRALHLPRLDIDAREALFDSNDPNPTAKGLMIFNTDTRCLEFWNSTEWISLCDDAPHPVRCGTGGVATLMRIGENYYYTHLYTIGGVERCWMVQNLSQGVLSASQTGTGYTYGVWQHGNDNRRYRGLYFGWGAAQDACPPGWSLPTASEMQGLQQALTALPVAVTSPRRFWHTVPYALAGHRTNLGSWSLWGYWGFWWSNELSSANEGWAFQVYSDGMMMHFVTPNVIAGLSVRCVRNQ